MTALSKIETMPLDFNEDKMKLLKDTVCKGASDSELQLFLYVCKRTGLDPFMKQIYSIPRGGQRTIQTSIDGFRLIAERTGKYAPGKECSFVYNENGNLVSATAYVKKMTADGTWHDISSTAMYSEFNPGKNNFWNKMPHVMLSKCAEAAALRKAFPAEMSGLYSEEEMYQAEKIDKEELREVEIDMSSEDIEKYLETWSENKASFSIYLNKVKETRQWTAKKCIDEFEKDREYTESKFHEWLEREKKKKAS